jgi:hypothetical protein
MSVVERHWVELLVLVTVLVSWAVYRRAFAHVPLRRDRHGEDSGG